MLRRARARGCFYRAFLQVAAAPLGAVGLREHADDLVPGAQRLERRQRETRRAGKCDAHGQYVRRARPALAGAAAARSLRSLSSRLRMRSRFISDR